MGDLNGAGDVGESEYGEKADIGEGMRDAIIVAGKISGDHRCIEKGPFNQLIIMRPGCPKAKELR